jgi:hypothetical protein
MNDEEGALKMPLPATHGRTAAISMALGLLLITHSHADPLPSKFFGFWEAYGDGGNTDYSDNGRLKCTEREGATITARRIDFNVESECGQIDHVRSGRFGDTVVNLTCFESEGRQRPIKYKDTQIWILFTVGRQNFMAQTSTRNMSTMLFKKCE